MSTLKTSNIQDTSGNNNSTPEEINQGRAKAWVNFDGTLASIGNGRDNYNVTSVTDNGTGDYTVNFTNAFANANYAVTGTSGGQSNTSNGAVYQLDQSTAKTTSACRIAILTSSGSLVDAPQIGMAFFGD